MRILALSLLGGCLVISTVVNAQETSAESRVAGVVEYQSPYGFCLSLPHQWRGFSILDEHWQGIKPYGGSEVTGGPEVIIRNPKWTETNPRQDIPIMVFTSRQWRSLQRGKFLVGPAPVGPSELGRNGKYVFALPARYNNAYSDGWQEVDNILKGHPLYAPCGKE